MAGKPFVATLEEHYADAALVAQLGALEGSRSPEIRRRLEDIDTLRLKEMDEAGIDIQVLSHGAPGAQGLQGEIAVRLAREANDRLQRAISVHPDRFAGFASLPTSEPREAANELERAVEKLGFKGAMIHGLTNGRFIDHEEYWPIFERAAKLNVPIYIHPAQPEAKIVETYYKDYSDKYPIFARAAWGFTVESATQAIRLILSGVFDRYSNLKIILGHFGEALPYLLWRVDESLSRPGNFSGSFRDIFCEHFYVTTSGNFSTPALVCCMMEMGIDRILFSVDWPFVSNSTGVKWVQSTPLSDEDRRKVLGENARRLLKLS